MVGRSPPTSHPSFSTPFKLELGHPPPPPPPSPPPPHRSSTTTSTRPDQARPRRSPPPTRMAPALKCGRGRRRTGMRPRRPQEESLLALVRAARLSVLALPPTASTTALHPRGDPRPNTMCPHCRRRTPRARPPLGHGGLQASQSVRLLSVSPVVRRLSTATWVTCVQLLTRRGDCPLRARLRVVLQAAASRFRWAWSVSSSRVSSRTRGAVGGYPVR